MKFREFYSYFLSFYREETYSNNLINDIFELMLVFYVRQTFTQLKVRTQGFPFCFLKPLKIIVPASQLVIGIPINM